MIIFRIAPILLALSIIIPPCFSTSLSSQIISLKTPKLYIETRIKEGQEALVSFQKVVTIEGDTISVDKFFEILSKVAENKVGSFLLNTISKHLLSNGKSTVLNVKIDQKNPKFAPGITEMLNTIHFVTTDVELQVIPEELLISQGGTHTILQKTPPEVSLFHELLHWARYLLFGPRDAVTEKSPPIKKIKNLLFKNYLFEESPIQKRWIGALPDRVKRKVEIALSTTIEGKDKIKQILISEIDEWSDPWKDGDLSVALELCPKMANTIITKLKPPSISQPHNTTEKKEDDDSEEEIDETTKLRNSFPLHLINPEEVRNIIGAGDSSGENLDKVCENSYRLAYNELHQNYLLQVHEEFTPLKLRYGHRNSSCFIDKDIVDWVKLRAMKGLEICL